MRRSQALVVAAIALAAVSACGSGTDKPAAQGGGAQGGGAKVATLESAAPKTAATTKAPERPRERLDTTPEEFEALLGPYNKCLKGLGVNTKDLKRDAGPGDVAAPATGPEAEKMDKAARECEEKFYPLPPWEKDPANPDARDFARGVVKCLKGKGVKFVEVAEDGISIALGGDDNDSRSITLGLDKMGECERQVAKQK